MTDCSLSRFCWSNILSLIGNRLQFLELVVKFTGENSVDMSSLSHLQSLSLSCTFNIEEWESLSKAIVTSPIKNLSLIVGPPMDSEFIFQLKKLETLELSFYTLIDTTSFASLKCLRKLKLVCCTCDKEAMEVHLAKLKSLDEVVVYRK